ncbi:MAG: aggregation factor core protein MAFp3, isoform C, partial [Candidatus Thiodiazotropha sp. (ex Lucinoma annulata)]|nr:aggregation factor core protein MAFp3, isoform C [Candidatus Thiodiazotropha sp. (ex Lucinoma annulata)]
SVNYATSDNSAAAGEDYNATNGSLSFADGVTTASFQVTVLDDSAYEGDERVNLSLSNPSGGAVIGANSAADLIITEDDQTPASGQIEFSVNTYAADEFNGSVTIEVVRQNGSTGVAMVNYTTSDGTATAGNDYIVNSATLIFANGEISKSFDVTLNDDADFEGIETFNLTLSNVFGALLGDITSASVSLSDDDDPPAAGAVVFTDSIQSVSEDGNSATISVSREGGSAGAISVDYTTMDGSAIASSDYTFSTGRISFAAGEAVSKSFDVAIINDTQLEGDEQLALQLVNPQGGAVLGTQSLSQLTITDDEAQSSSAILAFTVNSLSVDESSAVANISISRANVLTGSVTVDLSVESTTAVSGTDFNVTTGTLQFVDGESQKNISVEIIDNTLEDGNKTITFTIGNATGVAVIDTANSTVTLTILDDDGTTNPGNGDSGGGGGGGGSIDLLLLAFLLSLTLFLYKFRLNLSPKC